MLYPKNAAGELDPELFRNPTSEYRGAPFWSWNGRLEKDALLRQIDRLRQMGLGGFHMHCRYGLDTEYLGGEFMEIVRTCAQKAKELNMLAWIYDEERWPSGYAGGRNAEKMENRACSLLVTSKAYMPEDIDRQNHVIDSNYGTRRKGNGVLIARFGVSLNADGTLATGRRLGGAQDAAVGETVWYVYKERELPRPVYNYQTYVDTLDGRVVDEFIALTHERYKNAVGTEFGKTIPAVFTDEPQFSPMKLPAGPDGDAVLPWTDDLPETYAAAYDEDLLDVLPELLWDRPGHEPSVVRWRYIDHVTERFVCAFADRCGVWCAQNGLMLAGHVMEEPRLSSQTAYVGEAMRSYRSFHLPGIDILCDDREYTTAKQAQSAAHQYGRPGIISELYGVTNWDFDFRGHKLQGDWQAALGVTVRVHHLAWYTMKGEAKRDFPASISYQSPWYEEYATVEDHFARVHTALTRGGPDVRVGVIHPIESCWLYWAGGEWNGDRRAELDRQFLSATEWLLSGLIDFDFISESLLGELCTEAGAPLAVGCMRYDAVVVPGCRTLRSSTLERLEAFREAGGALIFMGDPAPFENARPSERPSRLAARSTVIPVQRAELLDALQGVRTVDVRLPGGARVSNALHQIRTDGDGKWLFLCHGAKPGNQDIPRAEGIAVRVKGVWNARLYDTLSGDVRGLQSHAADGWTEIPLVWHEHDSLLLRLDAAAIRSAAPGFAACVDPAAMPHFLSPQSVPERVPVTLSEPNCLLLDMAEYALDDGEWQPREELLRIDDAIRRQLGYPPRSIALAQPWTDPAKNAEHRLSLRFRFNSRISLEGAALALEDAESARITANGQLVSPEVCGWYVDEAIKTVKLPPVRQGENVLELALPFGRWTNVEWCYLLGDFGVAVTGRSAVLTPPVRELHFGDFTWQGLPFYGGNVTYKVPVLVQNGRLDVTVPQYRGALVAAELDGVRAGQMAFAPYEIIIPAENGAHTLGVTVYGNRANSFGALHNCDDNFIWYVSPAWRTEGISWCYEYRLKPMGLLVSPIVKA